MVAILRYILVLAVAGFAAPAHADEPTQPPIHYYPDRYPAPSARTNVLVAGALVAGGSYGVALGTSYLWDDAPTANDLRLPVVGPFMAVGGAGCGSNEAGCGTFTVVLRTIFATLSGIGQVGGLALMTEGLFMPTEAPRAATTPTWTVSPVASEDGFGFSLGGQF